MTVEELRDRSARLRAELLFAMGRGDAALVATGSNIRIAADVDEVLNAFHAEGVAEGVERERERILELVKGEYHVGPPFYLKLRNPLEPDPEWYVLLPKNVFWQDGNSGGCGTPASVLAPTKEVKP